MSQDVANYLDKELYQKVIDLHAFAVEFDGVPVGDALTKNLQAEAKIKKWLMAQHDVLDAHFTPFLKLRQ